MGVKGLSFKFRRLDGAIEFRRLDDAKDKEIEDGIEVVYVISTVGRRTGLLLLRRNLLSLMR